MKISDKLLKLSKEEEKGLESIFKEIDDMCLKNSIKVLDSFQKFNVNTSDFNEVIGYGYSDSGRDKLESIYMPLVQGIDLPYTSGYTGPFVFNNDDYVLFSTGWINPVFEKLIREKAYSKQL